MTRRTDTRAHSMDEGFQRLRAAYEATRQWREEDERWRTAAQENRRCGDCPFWTSDRCLVDFGSCSADMLACGYFDPPDYLMAREAIEKV